MRGPRGSTSEDLRVHVCARVQMSVFARVETLQTQPSGERHVPRRGHEHISTLINIIKNIWDIKCGTINLVQACLPSHGKGSEICHSRTIIILWKLQVPCAMLPHFLTSTPQVVCKPPKSRTYLRGRKCSNLPHYRNASDRSIYPTVIAKLLQLVGLIIWFNDLPRDACLCMSS